MLRLEFLGSLYQRLKTGTNLNSSIVRIPWPKPSIRKHYQTTKTATSRKHSTGFRYSCCQIPSQVLRRVVAKGMQLLLERSLPIIPFRTREPADPMNPNPSKRPGLSCRGPGLICIAPRSSCRGPGLFNFNSAPRATERQGTPGSANCRRMYVEDFYLRGRLTV